MAETPFVFGPFVFCPVRGELRRDGEFVPVGQRGIALLSALLQADGKPVSKAELMERAWPGMIVEEGNLTVQIAALRKLLGTSPDGHDWITTVPRVGYRLLRMEASVAVKAEPVVLPSLAVLPFQNLSGDPEQEYFADGVAEDIITALSRFKSFAVIARNSSFTYKGRAVDARQVASELGVRYILEGSVRRAGTKLRITSQLVDCTRGENLWARNFDGALDDVFDFQDRITESVASAVEPTIQNAELEHARRQRPGSITAYDICLRARAKLGKETSDDNNEAYAMLTEALTFEPDNAQLLALTNFALGHRTAMGRIPVGAEDRETCIALAHRSLRHAADDPMVLAHCAMSLIHVAKEYDWGMAIIQKAVDANPNNLMVVVRAGIAHIHCGDPDAALSHFHRAIRLSPRDPDARYSLTGISHVQMILGDFPEAIAWATRSLAENSNFDATYWMLIAANAQLGRLEEARRHLGAYLNLAPEAAIAGIKAGQPAKDPSRLAAILDGLRMAGLPEE